MCFGWVCAFGFSDFKIELLRNRILPVISNFQEFKFKIAKSKCTNPTKTYSIGLTILLEYRKQFVALSYIFSLHGWGWMLLFLSKFLSNNWPIKLVRLSQLPQRFIYYLPLSYYRISESIKPLPESHTWISSDPVSELYIWLSSFLRSWNIPKLLQSNTWAVHLLYMRPKETYYVLTLWFLPLFSIFLTAIISKMLFDLIWNKLIIQEQIFIIII